MKTIKEIADELGIPKKKVQNKINYESKKQGITIGNWKYILGKKTKLLSSEEEKVIIQWFNDLDSDSDNSDIDLDSGSDNSDIDLDSDYMYLKDRILKLEFFLEQEQKSSEHLKKLLDQQQRLALQDKKLLEEYKTEINDLKALSMNSQNTQEEQVENRPQKLSNQTETYKTQKKWYQFWK